MAATRSFSSVALLTFYAFTFLFLTRGPIQNGSKCLLRRPLGLFLTGTVFSGDAGLIFVVKLGGKFRLDLRSESYFKSSLQLQSGLNMDLLRFTFLATTLRWT